MLTMDGQRISSQTKILVSATTANSSYKKLAVTWLNEVQFFNQTLVQVDRFVLRNRQLLIAASRYGQL